MMLPKAGSGRGSNGDAALLLLNHPVHGGRALMDFTDLIKLAGVKEDAFGQRGFAGINVRHDADVAVFVKIRYLRQAAVSLT
jgi:hypothetical protein